MNNFDFINSIAKFFLQPKFHPYSMSYIYIYVCKHAHMFGRYLTTSSSVRLLCSSYLIFLCAPMKIHGILSIGIIGQHCKIMCIMLLIKLVFTLLHSVTSTGRNWIFKRFLQQILSQKLIALQRIIINDQTSEN